MWIFVKSLCGYYWRVYMNIYWEFMWIFIMSLCGYYLRGGVDIHYYRLCGCKYGVCVDLCWFLVVSNGFDPHYQPTFLVCKDKKHCHYDKYHKYHYQISQISFWYLWYLVIFVIFVDIWSKYHYMKNVCILGFDDTVMCVHFF